MIGQRWDLLELGKKAAGQGQRRSEPGCGGREKLAAVEQWAPPDIAERYTTPKDILRQKWSGEVTPPEVQASNGETKNRDLVSSDRAYNRSRSTL